LPVVSTSLGCSGLQVKNNRHLLIEYQADDFARKVVELLDDKQKREDLRREGRDLVEARYHWPRILAKLDEHILSPL
jgi:glycosyltransferase involved in cell wall biosynthesis